MRLIALSSNHASFHTVRFNKRGLSLIVGSKSDKGTTYNGVGKSLIIELLHFCLGSAKNSEFERKLEGWEFALEFELGIGEKHIVARRTSKQDVVYLDAVEKSLADFVSWIESRVFLIPPRIGDLSFRSLLPHFMRRTLSDYTDPLNTGYVSPYDVLMRNTFLLGLDVQLIATKRELREAKENVRKLRHNFKEDPLLVQFYAGARNPDVHLLHLEVRVRLLEEARDSFTVAENYYELQKAADDLAAEIERDKNTAFLLRDAVSNIDVSLKQQPTLRMDRVEELYGELLTAFRAESLARLEDVEVFHDKLLRNRATRLSSEKLNIQHQLEHVEKGLRIKQVELDAKLRTLGQSRALDQYTAIVNEVSELNAQIHKLRDYKSIELQYSNREAALKAEMSKEVIKTNSYLEETRNVREETFSLFKKYVGRFYPDVEAGISIRNNEGSNKIRFDLDVSVANDSSDGINEVRIFCYDLSLLTARQNHTIDFLVHDSRLFANMDVRQRATLFRLASEVTKTRDMQYIATLNPDEISGMESEFSMKEFTDLIATNVVLELKDDSPAGKLLGIQVDMRY